MFKNILAALLVILPVALLSGGLVYWRAEPLTEQDEIKSEAVPTPGKPNPKKFTFAVLALGVMAGLLISVLYIWMAGRWPDTAPKVYLWLAIGVTIVLSVAVAFVRPMLKMGGVPECIALHILWGAGYGWLLPLVVRWLGQS